MTPEADPSEGSPFTTSGLPVAATGLGTLMLMGAVWVGRRQR